MQKVQVVFSIKESNQPPRKLTETLNAAFHSSVAEVTVSDKAKITGTGENLEFAVLDYLELRIADRYPDWSA